MQQRNNPLHGCGQRYNFNMEVHDHARIDSSHPRSSWHRLRYAYHETRHAVVGFWFGRSIAVLSIDREYVAQLRDGDSARLRGLCLFDIFAEREHGGWRVGLGGVNRLAILSAGTYIGMVACHEHEVCQVQCFGSRTTR